MAYGEELNINYDAIKELHDRAHYLKYEMKSIVSHSNSKKIQAQAMVLHSVCDTIITFTTSQLKVMCQWDTFVVDFMSCYYLFTSVYNNMMVDFEYVFDACKNSDEVRKMFKWMVKLFGQSSEMVMTKGKYTWIYDK